MAQPLTLPLVSPTTLGGAANAIQTKRTTREIVSQISNPACQRKQYELTIELQKAKIAELEATIKETEERNYDLAMEARDERN